MSPSSTLRASVYTELPLPPGTSLSWIPPSSLYCCHRSVSRVSAAARNLRIAASPGVRRPDFSSGALLRAKSPSPSRAAPQVAAPAANVPFLKNERRFALLLNTLPGSFMSILLFWTRGDSFAPRRFPAANGPVVTSGCPARILLLGQSATANVEGAGRLPYKLLHAPLILWMILQIFDPDNLQRSQVRP